MRGQEGVEARIAKARRGTAGASNDAQAQRAVAQYLDRYVGPLKHDFSIAKERIERLFGIRGSADERAVRVGDLSSTKGLELESSLVSAAPTADQHNALVRDIRRIRDALNNVG